MERKYRGACDTCHTRKIKCANNGPGACTNCQSSGRQCVFSLRDEMGRPRKSSTRAKEKANRTSKDAEDPASQEDFSSQPTAKTQQFELPPPSTMDDIETWRVINGTDTFRMDEDYTKDMSVQWLPQNMHVDPMAVSTSMSMDIFNAPHMQLSHLEHSQTQFLESLPTPPEPNNNFSTSTTMFTDGHGQQTATIPENNNNPGGVAMSDLSKQLNTLVFQLQLKKKNRWTNTNEDITNQTTIFQTVTRICDLVQTVLSFGPENRRSGLESGEESRSSLQMLAVTAIASVVDVYHTIQQAHAIPIGQRRSSEDGADSKDPSSIDIGGQMSRAMNWDVVELTRLLHLVTMDFHLSRLQQAFDAIKQEGLPLEMAGSDLEIQLLRSECQRTVDMLRCR